METFSAVVEAGSFTAAADALGLSKSFVSKRVTQLEQQLGVRLLYRTTRKLSLSDEGSRFYNHCRLIMAEAERAKAEIMESHGDPRGKIRITVPQSLLISGVGKVLLEFQRQFPDIELSVIASGRVEDLVEAGIDVALRIGQLEDSTLISRRLAECAFHVVASPQYVERCGEPAHPADLTQHNCVVYGESKLGRSWPFQMPNGESLTVKVQGKLTCTDGNLVVDAAVGGLGICFGPDFLFKKYVDEGSLLLILDRYYTQKAAISALYPLNRNLSRRVRVLIDFLAQHIPERFKHRTNKRSGMRSFPH